MKSNLSRRQFLAHSAGIAGASIGLTPKPGSASHGTPAARPLRVGIIGLGDRGSQLLRSLRRIERGVAAAEQTGDRVDVRVVGLCDVDSLRLRRALEQERVHSAPGGGRRAGDDGRVRAYTNYRVLLDAPDVDAVIIATPVYRHAEQVLTALAAGKHVYCEKPLAHERDACRRIVAAVREAEKCGQVFQMGFQRRFSPRYCGSIRALQDGDAGRILFVRAQWHTARSGPRSKPWLYQREKSGDLILEQASHQLDVLNWLMGTTPERACGMGGINRYAGEPPGRDTMDHYSAVLEYPGQVKVQLSHLTFAVPSRHFCGIGELVFAETMGVDLATGLAWNAAGESEQLATEKGSATEKALSSFVRCAASGTPSRVGAQVGYEAAMSAFLCQKAIETGRTIAWEELG